MKERSAVASLAALAHAHRLRIFRLLVKQGPSGMAAGEIAEHVGISATNASFHLKELNRAGLLRATREGRYVRYPIDVEGTRKLLNYPGKNCC
jgi:DNA-binding transcriptional ArsR family regulator